MIDWQKYLSPHGQTKEACEYVIRRFSNAEIHSNNMLVQRWIECSRECLKEKHAPLKTEQA